MLRFRLQQLYVPSLERYFLPLPKLGAPQMRILTANLEGRGFNVRPGSGSARLIALKGSQRISIDGRVGLAASGADLLDALAPAIPSLVPSRKHAAVRVSAGVAALYYSPTRSGVQLFPRLESLRTWTCLRRDGLCGLTPDEAVALKHVLGRAKGRSLVECVTARPREGSMPIQTGRNVYYRSSLAVAEFLSSLRTIDSGGPDSASYLPRDSIVALPPRGVDTLLASDELGEWCCVG